MATSSHWAGNAYAKDSIRPAPQTEQHRAFVQTKGTAVPRSTENPAQQQPRASDRQHTITRIPPPFPPKYYTDEDTPPQKQGGVPFHLWVLIVVLVGAAFYGVKVQYIDPWWQGVQNQMHYGDSKMGYSVLQLTGDDTLNNIITFVRTDTKTGSAYLIVLDVQPGKKPQELTKAIMGKGATNQTITSATAEDANGDGKTDVIVHIQDSPVTFAILNDGSGNLTWATP